LIKYIADRHPEFTDTEPPADSDNCDSDTLMLMQSFIRDAGKTMTVLQDLFADNDNNPPSEFNYNNLQKFTVVVHGIKSTLWIIKETVLSDFALKLEQAGRDHDLEFIKTNTPIFMQELQGFINKIKGKYNI
jgi:hypothetical protein